MSDQTLRRADELLTELVEIVETARAVPMSSSCVISREHVLDILDDLRDVMPPEMAEARRVVAQRDDLLRSAAEQEAMSRAAAAEFISQTREQTVATAETHLGEARAYAEQLVAQAESQAGALLGQAREQAEEIALAARREHMELVSATSVHHAAAAAAAELRAESERYVEHIRAEAERESTALRTDAARAARELRSDSDAYAESTLVDLIEVLRKAATTAEQGRRALANRREPVQSEHISTPAPSSEPGSELPPAETSTLRSEDPELGQPEYYLSNPAAAAASTSITAPTSTTAPRSTADTPPTAAPVTSMDGSAGTD